MLEARAREHHRKRMTEALLHEIGALLEGELSDPRIGLATVSEVQLSPDGKSARVFVSVDGDEHEAEETMAGLAAARGYMRREIAIRLRLARAPELMFHLDQTEKYGARIDELLSRTQRKKKK
ncbi:MAG: 30S ribosome-binding factor RbfA [Terriglobales bacterium]